MRNRSKVGIILFGALILSAVLLGIFAYHRMQQQQHYITLIEAVADEYGVDPALVAAVVWRESRFRAHVIGGVGELGLMQVTPVVGQEWASQHNQASFDPEQLLDPVTNLRAGAWYLARAIDHWSDREDPLPYALAQYNAGRTHALRWAREDAGEAAQFVENVTYPSTRAYIRDVLLRYRGYVVEQPNE